MICKHSLGEINCDIMTGGYFYKCLLCKKRGETMTTIEGAYKNFFSSKRSISVYLNNCGILLESDKRKLRELGMIIKGVK